MCSDETLAGRPSLRAGVTSAGEAYWDLPNVSPTPFQAETRKWYPIPISSPSITTEYGACASVWACTSVEPRRGPAIDGKRPAWISATSNVGRGLPADISKQFCTETMSSGRFPSLVKNVTVNERVVVVVLDCTSTSPAVSSASIARWTWSAEAFTGKSTVWCPSKLNANDPTSVRVSPLSKATTCRSKPASADTVLLISECRFEPRSELSRVKACGIALYARNVTSHAKPHVMASWRRETATLPALGKLSSCEATSAGVASAANEAV